LVNEAQSSSRLAANLALRRISRNYLPGKACATNAFISDHREGSVESQTFTDTMPVQKTPITQLQVRSAWNLVLSLATAERFLNAGIRFALAERCYKAQARQPARLHLMED
jgi:hypothetical protein